MNQINWFQTIIDITQAIISGVFVGLVIFRLDERRAKRERRLSDFRIASNWFGTEPKASLRNFDLTKTNLSGHKFIKANLEEAIISYSDLWATNFSEANLRHTDFQKSRLMGTKFVKATAFRANFSNAVISTGIDPIYEYLPDFTNAHLGGAKFTGTWLNGVVMKETDLGGTDFSRATVLDCDFTGANLANSNWKTVKRVENCIWKNVIVDNSENFPDYLWNEIQAQNPKLKTKQKNSRKKI
ncbi:MAG: pentapeptide repeat-containing protein [Chloroflexota bacterium]